MSSQQVYDAAGFGRAVPRGTRPAVVVVDFSYGFTDTAYPTAADMSAQIAVTRNVTDKARDLGFPVIFTTIAYHVADVGRLAWLRKATGMAALTLGSRLIEIDAATGIQPSDPVVQKQGASAFFGTNLAAVLTGAGVDTLVVAGATTSGCVRATVVDAVQSGFNTLVISDGCADRAKVPHDANLFDMQQKYADVVSGQDVLDWFGRIVTK